MRAIRTIPVTLPAMPLAAMSAERFVARFSARFSARFVARFVAPFATFFTASFTAFLAAWLSTPFAALRVVFRAASRVALCVAFCAALPASLGSQAVLAAEAAPVAEDPVVEQRLIAIAAELRCLVCQNESLAGSRADLALDLRREIRGMIARGDSDDAIRTFLTERYGEFILYRPRFTTTTLLLWTGPALLLVIGLVILARQLRRRTRTAIPAEEADLSDEERARLAAALADGPDTPTSGRRES